LWITGVRRVPVYPISIQLDTPPTWSPRTYEDQVDNVVAEVVHTVSGEMRGQPASMVYELINAHLERRLPGAAVNQEGLRDAAARIAVGLPVHW
jgi:hypothetical protein